MCILIQIVTEISEFFFTQKLFKNSHPTWSNINKHYCCLTCAQCIKTHCGLNKSKKSINYLLKISEAQHEVQCMNIKHQWVSERESCSQVRMVKWCGKDSSVRSVVSGLHLTSRIFKDDMRESFSMGSSEREREREKHHVTCTSSYECTAVMFLLNLITITQNMRIKLQKHELIIL